MYNNECVGCADARRRINRERCASRCSAHLRAEAVNALKEIRKHPGQGDLVAISAADPLNLTGLVTPGQRVPSQPGLRVLYRDGIPIAHSAQGKISFLVPIEPQDEWQTRNVLLRKVALNTHKMEGNSS